MGLFFVGSPAPKQKRFVMSQAYSYEKSPVCPEEFLARREWMSVLAGGGLEKLEAAFAGLAKDVDYTFLRKPESGLLMMQARTGNSGRRFNLGEVLVTRSVVSLRLRNGNRAVEGYAMVMGESFRKAELAAVFDALLQTGLHDAVMGGLIEPLRAAARCRELCKNEKTRRTKVDFYTLVRGED